MGAKGWCLGPAQEMIWPSTHEFQPGAKSDFHVCDLLTKTVVLSAEKYVDLVEAWVNFE